MGLKKYVSGQWVDDSGVDVPVKEVKIDNTSIVDDLTDTASIATTGSYDGDGTSPSYNPLSTKGYVDNQISQLPEPMVYTGVISITADSTDTTKCSIAVSAPASAANIKKGFTYKVSFIAASPVYTGTIKIGDTLIAAKNVPKVDATWVADTDWNVIPSGDETGYVIGKASGTTQNNLVKWGQNGYEVDDSGATFGTNYLQYPNGQRIYCDSTAPTGNIPDGSIGVGW